MRSPFSAIVAVTVVHPDGAVIIEPAIVAHFDTPDFALRDALMEHGCSRHGASLSAVAALLAAEFTAKGTPRKVTERARLRYYAADERYTASSLARGRAYMATLIAEATSEG